MNNIKLLLSITIAIAFVSYASAASQVSCQAVLKPIFKSGGAKAQITVVQPNGVVAVAQNSLVDYMGQYLTNGNGYNAFLSSETSCVNKLVQPFAADKKKTSFNDRAGVSIQADGKFSLAPIWLGDKRISNAQLTCLSNGQNYAVVDGTFVSFTFELNQLPIINQSLTVNEKSVAVKNFIGPSSCKHHSVHNYYLKHYGYVDRVDKMLKRGLVWLAWRVVLRN
eukprot:gene2341-2655_t